MSAMMRPLLVDHELLAPFQANLNIAMGWAAEIARDAGMSPDDAAKRLKVTMEFEEMARGEEGQSDG